MIAWAAASHTTDAANWSYYDSLALLHDIRGKYMSPGATQTATRRYVPTVRIALQAGGDSQARVDSTARPVNAPEALSAVWESEFNTDPTTLDMNGDGLGDWAPATGTFDPAGVSGGIWNATSNLVTAPDNDFTQLTTVELRFRCTKRVRASPGVAFRHQRGSLEQQLCSPVRRPDAHRRRHADLNGLLYA